MPKTVFTYHPYLSPGNMFGHQTYNILNFQIEYALKEVQQEKESRWQAISVLFRWN